MTAEWHWSTVLIDKWPNGLETQQYLQDTYTTVLWYMWFPWQQSVQYLYSQLLLQVDRSDWIYACTHMHSAQSDTSTPVYTDISKDMHLCTQYMAYTYLKTIYFLWVSAWVHHTLGWMYACEMNEWLGKGRLILSPMSCSGVYNYRLLAESGRKTEE